MAKRDEVEEVVEAVQPKQVSAKDARAKILGDSKTRKEYVTFKGFELEIRQPTVTEFINSNSVEEGQKRDASKVSVSMLVRYAYMRGTNDRLFEDSDVDSLLNMPMSGEFLNLIQAMNSLLDIKVEDEVKN